MNYEDMSDFEINKLVVGVVNGCLEWTFNSKDRCYVRHIRRGKTYIVETYYINDYCNNPSDAWPIIVENRITVNPYDDESQGWTATFDTSFFIDDENPLRAAMICFLKMKDAEK